MLPLAALVLTFACGACLPSDDAGIVSLRADGTHAAVVAASGPDVYLWQPTWAPDGRRFAFVAEPRRGQRRLRIGRRVVVRNAFYPAWSPDGRWIAFVRDYALWVTRPDGTRVHRVVARTHGAIFSPVAWSPDSRRLGFVADDVLYVVRADGSHLVRVSRYRAADPAFSRDGHSVYYLSGPDNLFVAAVPRRHDLATGRDVAFLARPHPGLTDAAWSPDRRYLAYTVPVPTSTGVELADLWVVRLADGRRIRVERNIAGGSFGISWRP